LLKIACLGTKGSLLKQDKTSLFNIQMIGLSPKLIKTILIREAVIKFMQEDFLILQISDQALKT